jgi:hypothetical protein
MVSRDSIWEELVATAALALAATHDEVRAILGDYYKVGANHDEWLGTAPLDKIVEWARPILNDLRRDAAGIPRYDHGGQKGLRPLHATQSLAVETYLHDTQSPNPSADMRAARKTTQERSEALAEADPESLWELIRALETLAPEKMEQRAAFEIIKRTALLGRLRRNPELVARIHEDFDRSPERFWSPPEW